MDKILRFITVLFLFLSLIIGCDNPINRKNFLFPVEKHSAISSIGFSASDNSKLGKDCFASPSDSDNLIKIDLPGKVTDYSDLIISFTLSSSIADLSAWDGNKWLPWTSGQSTVSFRDLTETKRIKTYQTIPYINVYSETEYRLQLNKPLWLRLDDIKQDYYTDNGQNVVLHLQLVDQDGESPDAVRSQNGTWTSEGNIIYDDLTIVNYPPVYDAQNNVFPLIVKPFKNGTLTITFPDGIFTDEHGAEARGYTAKFPYEGIWIGQEYTITFDSNGESPGYTTYKAVYGSNVILPAKDYFIKDKHRLEGWYYDNGLFLRQCDEDSYVTGNITFYANWEQLDKAPDPPTNLHAVTGNGQIYLTWESPVNGGLIGGEVATGLTYTVYYSQVSFSNLNLPVTSISNIETTQYEITPLISQKILYFRVSASNDNNQEGIASEEYVYTPKALTEALLGKINKPSITKSAGLTADDTSETISFSGPLQVNTDYTLAIIDRPDYAKTSHVLIDSTTGTLTISKDVVPDDSGQYSVIAKGIGDYANDVTVIFTLNIKPVPITSISYNTVNAVWDTEITTPILATVAPSTPATGVVFSISGDLNIDTGLDFDTNTGAISGTPTNVGTWNYTVTITGGDGTKYEGSSSTSATFKVTTAKKNLETSLDYNDINITYGTSKTVSPIWSNSMTYGSNDVRYAITEPASVPNGVILVEDTGALTVSSTAPVSVSNTYTITATGSGNYTDSRKTTVNITVVKATIGNPTYSDITVVYGNTENIFPQWTGTAPTAKYTLGTNSQGITIDPDSGKITVPSNTALGDYTLYFQVDGSENYTGTYSDSIKITVNAPITGTLKYVNLEVAHGREAVRSPSWQNHTVGQIVEYSLQTSHNGVSIDTITGAVRVVYNQLADDITKVIILATGIGNYTGVTNATLTVAKRNPLPSTATLSYNDILVQKGSIDSSSPSPHWLSLGYTVVYSLRTLDGTSLPTGISIHPTSGVVTVYDTATEQAEKIYQVKAEGIGTWKGWKKAEIEISVYNTFYYEYQPALTGQPFSLVPGNSPASNNLSLSNFMVNMALPDGLNLNGSTGEISGRPTTRQLPTEYTVTATLGNGNRRTAKLILFIKIQPGNTTDLKTIIGEETANQKNTANLNIIDTSLITNMNQLFNNNTSFDGNISQWDVSSVTDMGEMFNGASSFNGDISNWDVSNVEKMSGMFKNASEFNQDISNWDVSSVNNMSDMFNNASKFNQDISDWNVSSVTQMNDMFHKASAFNQDISTWNVSNVIDMNRMFKHASLFNGDISNWQVTNVESMIAMFRSASAFNGEIINWNVDKVTNMNRMFQNASAFNQDLSNWNVGKVTEMNYMFSNASAFNQDLSNWIVSNVNSKIDMFLGSGLDGNEPLWY